VVEWWSGAKKAYPASGVDAHVRGKRGKREEGSFVGRGTVILVGIVWVSFVGVRGEDVSARRMNPCCGSERVGSVASVG